MSNPFTVTDSRDPNSKSNNNNNSTNSPNSLLPSAAASSPNLVASPSNYNNNNQNNQNNNNDTEMSTLISPQNLSSSSSSRTISRQQTSLGSGGGGRPVFRGRSPINRLLIEDPETDKKYANPYDKDEYPFKHFFYAFKLYCCEYKMRFNFWDCFYNIVYGMFNVRNILVVLCLYFLVSWAMRDPDLIVPNSVPPNPHRSKKKEKYSHLKSNQRIMNEHGLSKEDLKSGGGDNNHNNKDDSSVVNAAVDVDGAVNYYPNGKLGTTMHLSTTEQRRSAKLCDTYISSGKLPIPWIVDHVNVGGVLDITEFLNEEMYWSYNQKVSSSVSGNENNNKNCILDFGHLRRILGRTRLTATLTENGRHDGVEESLTASSKKLQVLLDRYTPSWRVVKFSSNTAVLERRAKVFVFGITGGNLPTAQRARFAEMTWGSRTPIQWFSDQWDPQIRPIVDLHPLYVKDRFKYLTFKISRIWQVVHSKYQSQDYDWYIRVWDDNYFYEENLYPILYRLPFSPQKDPVLAGKIGIRHLGPQDTIFPFAGGGAGWYLSNAGLEKFGNSIDDMEAWIPKLRARTDIFLPHDMHDEDVFLTAWIGKYQNISCINIPGVEHVSPGLGAKQRCLSDEVLKKLRWDPDSKIFFDYTGRNQRELRIEDTWYAYSKPVIWHYMSPRRLLRLEGLLYPERVNVELPSLRSAPQTAVDLPPKKAKRCYPGVPESGPLPTSGISIFEKPLPQEMRDHVVIEN